METNYERWSNTASLSRNWDERTKLVTQWLPAGAHVADIGCGNMTVEKHLQGGSYHPVDVVQRDSRTLVVDLNRQQIPNTFFRNIDHVTLLGTLEYLANPAALLQQLAEHGQTLVCTYQLANFVPRNVREKEGWFNHFTAAEFAALLNSCGFLIEKAQLFDNQGIYLARPRNAKVRPAATRKSTSSKRKLVLSGFFGRGNAGDEALLQVQYEKLSPHFEIVISVEERGAYQGFWDWYPYNKCQIIHHAEQAMFHASDVWGLHVGGGDLPIGFNGGQVIAAASAGKKISMTGIDVGLSFHLAAETNPTILRDYMQQVKLIAVRSEQGQQFLHAYAPHSQRGADWAYHLPTDEAPDSPRNLVLVVLREFPVDNIQPEYRACVTRLINALEKQGHPYALLPFCPEDERFLDALDACWGAPRQVHWWNPRRLKQLIAQAAMVVSIGRLHPLIFAATTGTPCVFSDMQTMAGQWSRKITKAQYLCEETGMRYYGSFSELCDWFERRDAEPPISRAQFPSTYAGNFEQMLRDLLTLYSG